MTESGACIDTSHPCCSGAGISEAAVAAGAGFVDATSGLGFISVDWRGTHPRAFARGKAQQRHDAALEARRRGIAGVAGEQQRV